MKHYEKLSGFPSMKICGRYTCPGCRHTFARKKNLNTHMKNCSQKSDETSFARHNQTTINNINSENNCKK